jgi:hypothetical protein
VKAVSLLIGSALTLGIVTTAQQAHAQDAPAAQFGLAHQLAISSDVGLSIQHQFAGTDSTTFTLHPAADYFLIDHLSLGGYVHFSFESGGGVDITKFGLGPRVGYDFNLSSRFSFWPKAGISFNHTSVSPDRAPSQNNDALTINLFAPFLFHPVEHFFAGFGPNFDVDLTGDAKQTVLGAQLIIGGYFGL